MCIRDRSDTCQLLNIDLTPLITKEFNQYLASCLEKKLITENQYKRLALTGNTQTQIIYFLPKVHKNPIKLRPIVSCINGPTQTAPAYLDRLLQPYMRKVKSYLKNSTELVKILQTFKVPTHAFLITLDIKSLYTNISHKGAIMAFLKRFKQDPNKCLPFRSSQVCLEEQYL